MSQTSSKLHYGKVDGRGRIPLPESFREALKAKEGSWIEMELHVIDNMPAVIATLAKSRNGQ